MKELLLVNRVNPKDVQWEYNPVCHDSKIHIRLKHYTSNKMIIGFEDKLTFLLVYMIDNYLKTLKGKSEFKADITLTTNVNTFDDKIFGKYIVKFKETDDYRILQEIVSNKFVNCKGIRITQLYTRKEDPGILDLFGHISPNLLPEITEGNNSISFFTKCLGISVQQYLFDDNFVLLISNFKFKNPNTKFENKINKKLKRKLEEEKTNLKENDLW